VMATWATLMCFAAGISFDNTAWFRQSEGIRGP
jgi:hypothetical protein